MKLNERLRAAGVSRWHIVETTRQQNLAEHQYNVALIARRLGALMGLTHEEQKELMVEALTHDEHEIFDGDVPSSTKKTRDLPESKVERIIHIADKMEALWFIQDRHVNRPDVVLDCRSRLLGIAKQLSAEERAIAARVAEELGLGL